MRSSTRVFAKYRLTINFSKGKAEALIIFAGRGSAKARKELMETDDSKIKFTVGDTDFVLRATSTYKHVGTTTTIAETLHAEITPRLQKHARCWCQTPPQAF